MQNVLKVATHVLLSIRELQVLTHMSVLLLCQINIRIDYRAGLNRELLSFYDMGTNADATVDFLVALLKQSQ